MNMPRLGFGIVGTGMIAGVIADAIAKSTNAKLLAVSGLRIDTAQNFVANRPGVSAVQGHEGLLRSVTSTRSMWQLPRPRRKTLPSQRLQPGKHVLVDKPFMNHGSLL